MSVKFACSCCGKRLRARDEDAGKCTRCTGCARVQRIPDGNADGDRVPSASVGAPPGPACLAVVAALALLAAGTALWLAWPSGTPADKLVRATSGAPPASIPPPPFKAGDNRRPPEAQGGSTPPAPGEPGAPAGPAGRMAGKSAGSSPPPAGRAPGGTRPTQGVVGKHAPGPEPDGPAGAPTRMTGPDPVYSPPPVPKGPSDPPAAGAQAVADTGPTARKSKILLPKETGLIAPLELLDFEDAGLTYRVRRLQAAAPRRLRLGVSRRGYDDMGRLLRSLGEGFPPTELRDGDFLSPDRLRPFDVLFLNCGAYEVDDYRQDAQWAARRYRENLARYVEQGGTLYASDKRYGLITQVFPSYGVKDPPYTGVEQTVQARVVDAGLKNFLGRSSIPLHFNMGGWLPAAFDAKTTTRLLEGEYRAEYGRTQYHPLLVKFRCGKGTVIFTSFHNEAQNTEIERKLLEYLVFSAVNARAESLVTELTAKAGFLPGDIRPVELDPGKPPAAGTYRSTKRGLQVGVGFNDVGARLRLTMTGPGGRTIKHEDTATFLVEVRNAPPGEWRYELSPVSLPHPHFPALLAVGRAK